MEEEVRELKLLRDAVFGEVRKIIVGQEEPIETMLVALLAQGHVLLEGVPGTAKTLMVRTLAAAVDLGFGRVQFTPDLMPSDILGTNVFDFKSGSFRLTKGPIFTELLLADEINRAPAKTQSALLEAMQERQVSIDGARHELSDDFTVFATQNPVEQEGTYPLPEAQLDRFLVKIQVGYPTADEEDRILSMASVGVGSVDVEEAGVIPVASRERLAELRRLASKVLVEDAVRGYIRDLMRATRETPMILLGAGPRAGVHLLVASRWFAALDGRLFVTPDDVQRALHPVVCHRLVLAPEVELDGLGAGEVMDRISATVEVPR
ncbi:MAG TPA: MoxR family ATPase [Sandaracinaceae bacterium LLY-WYZ-13_1]|nr:MoxR family ATPase [Sandaracinaceae bacterium LLY-WYZ-13_1]